MQEVDIFLHLDGAERRGCGGEFARRDVGERPQGGEIGHGHVHVVQGAPDLVQQERTPILADGGEQDQDQRLLRRAGVQRQNRMDHGAYVVAARRQGGHDAVDQEGRVRLGDLQRLKPQVARPGAQRMGELYPRGRRLALADETPEAGAYRREVVDLHPRQFVRLKVVADLPDEARLGRTQGGQIKFPGERLLQSRPVGGVDFIVIHGCATSSPREVQHDPSGHLDQPGSPQVRRRTKGAARRGESGGACSVDGGHRPERFDSARSLGDGKRAPRRAGGTGPA